MLKLDEYLSKNQTLQKAFWERLIAERGPALFKDTLFLSFLGARICYASTKPLALFAEERFRQPEKLLAFLMRLKTSGHTSIFAHSPLVVSVKGLTKEEKASLACAFYKAWWTPEGEALCLNLRHLAEVLGEGVFQEVLSASLEASKAWKEFRCLCFAFEPNGEPKLMEEGRLGDWAERPPELLPGLFDQMEVIVIDVAPESTAPFGWLAVLVEGFSRLFSHQFVRHTWLNFNQRSHRYTEVDKFVLPPSFEAVPEGRQLYEETINKGMGVYRRLVEAGVKKEDARFVTPQGASTTLIATGPYFVWEDFVRKRHHPKAQWEIRRLAKAVEQALKRLNKV